MPDDKPASEWTPRDHFIAATAILIECKENPTPVRFDPRLLAADIHARLATASASNVTVNELDEDYRP